MMENRYYDPKLVMALATQYLEDCLQEEKIMKQDFLCPEIHVYLDGESKHFCITYAGTVQWREGREGWFLKRGETLLSNAGRLAETVLIVNTRHVLTCSTFVEFVGALKKALEHKEQCLAAS